MNKIELDLYNYLIYRETPWDTKVFGFKTNEILEIKYKNVDNLVKLVKLFDEENIKNNIKFTYARVDANNKALRKIIQDFNFYYAETSLDMVIRDIQRYDFISVFGKELPLIIPDEKDFEEIKNIAKMSFDYGRFHEDYNISEEKAQNRYYFWIDDLKKRNKFLVYKNKNIVESFLAYQPSKKNKDIRLILAGSKKDKAFLSIYFWASFMAYFQKLGYVKINAVISASNISIIRLYFKLNFFVEKTTVGFHKLY